jgi:hypothetical protein
MSAWQPLPPPMRFVLTKTTKSKNENNKGKKKQTNLRKLLYGVG